MGRSKWGFVVWRSNYFLFLWTICFINSVHSVSRTVNVIGISNFHYGSSCWGLSLRKMAFWQYNASWWSLKLTFRWVMLTFNFVFKGRNRLNVHFPGLYISEFIGASCYLYIQTFRNGKWIESCLIYDWYIAFIHLTLPS